MRVAKIFNFRHLLYIFYLEIHEEMNIPACISIPLVYLFLNPVTCLGQGVNLFFNKKAVSGQKKLRNFTSQQNNFYRRTGCVFMSIFQIKNYDFIAPSLSRCFTLKVLNRKLLLLPLKVNSNTVHF